MARSIILLVLLMLSTPANAMGKQWVEDWWDNVYEQRIDKEQYEELRREAKEQCDTKLEWYQQKLDEKPSSEYYQYKLDTWKERCE